MIRDETVLLTNLVTCCSRFTIFPWRSSRPGSSLQKEKKCLELLNCLSSFLLYSLADEKKISIISTVYVFIQLRVQDIYQKKKQMQTHHALCSLHSWLAFFTRCTWQSNRPPVTLENDIEIFNKVELKVKLTCKNKQ